MRDIVKNYDVVIIGGGLAGLTLASQLLRDIPDISICLIHDAKFPNEETAFKVGEATIDLGGYYLRELLGDEYLGREHFIKMGMRFIYTNDELYKEMGIRNFPKKNSYQFERGKLENHFFSLLQDKIDILQNTRFLDVEDEGHFKRIHVVELSKVQKIINSRWIVDASGRKKVISRKYNLSSKGNLPNSSVWFRVKGAVLVDEIYPAEEDNPFYGMDRSYSSLHIDGKGYWIWVLRLSDHTTSVGICFSENIHQFDSLSDLEKTFEWLKTHERVFYDYLLKKQFSILDFKYLRKYASIAQPCISENHWALTGDACIFLDPVYSSGIDLMCIENTFIVDVLAQEKNGQDIKERMAFYNSVISDLVVAYSNVFDKMYEQKDNWYYIFVKYVVDSVFYFGSICPCFMNKGMRDFKNAKIIWDKIHKIYMEYDKVNSILKTKKFSENNRQNNLDLPRFINLSESLFAKINSYLTEPDNDLEKLINLLQDNYQVMCKICEYISSDRNLYDLYIRRDGQPEIFHTSWRYGEFFPNPEMVNRN